MTDGGIADSRVLVGSAYASAWAWAVSRCPLLSPGWLAGQKAPALLRAGTSGLFNCVVAQEVTRKPSTCRSPSTCSRSATPCSATSWPPTSPWTIVPATQFYDFAALAASWTERDGVATIAPLLVQPIAPDDIAHVLAEVATGEPQGRYVDVAGPEPQDLVDMARRTNDVLGRNVKLVPTWSGPLGEEMAGNVLLPGENARIAPTTFDQWLAAGAR
jgi:hypothetical protein